MNTTLIAETFSVIVKQSGKASLVAVLVLLIIFVGKRWLSPRWRHALWLLVFARLLLPDLGSWRWSLQRWDLPPTRQMSASDHHATKATQPSVSSGPVSSPATRSTPMQATASDFSTGPYNKPTSWQVFSTLWLLGVVAMLATMLITWLRFRKRVLIALTDVPAEWSTLAKQCLGDRSSALCFSSAVEVPTLMGLWKPRIVMPATLASDLPAAQREHLLLHELAHWRRGELWIQLLSSVLLALHWFNPLLWLSHRRLLIEGEACADAWVVAQTKEARGYGETLMHIVTQGAALFGLLLMPGVLCMSATGSELKERLIELNRGQRRRRVWSLAALALLIVTAAAVFTRAERGSSTPPSSKATARTLEVLGQPSGIVLAPDGKPMPKAEVWMFQGKQLLAKRPVDTEGRFTFTEQIIFDSPDVIGARDLYTLVATAPGFGFGWRNFRPSDRIEPSIQLTLDVEAEYRTKVMTKDCNILPGALIWCVGAGGGKRPDQRDYFHLDESSGFLLAKADDQGLITIRGLPPVSIGVNVRGPDTSLSYHWLDLPGPSEKPKTYNHWCAPGTTVRGHVRDPDGKPVVGAQITFKTNWHFYALMSCVTDADGKFEIAHLYNTKGPFNPGNGEHIVSLLHPEWTAVPLALPLEPGVMDNLVIQAVPGTLVKGVAIDSESLKPVPTAQMHISFDIPGSERHFHDWEILANDQGEFSFRVPGSARLSLKTMPRGFCFVEPDDPVIVKGKSAEEKIIFETPPMRPVTKVILKTDPPEAGFTAQMNWKADRRSSAKPQNKGRGQPKMRDSDGHEINGIRGRLSGDEQSIVFDGQPTDSAYSLVVFSKDMTRCSFSSVELNANTEQTLTVNLNRKAVTELFQIVDDDGKPYQKKDFQVDLKLDDVRITGFEHIETDKEGMIRISGIPEKATLQFGRQLGEKYEFKTQRVTLTDDLSKPILVKVGLSSGGPEL